MSFVDVFPTEPVIATTRASLRARTAPPSAASAAWASSGTSVAAAPARAGVVEKRLAAGDGDEQVARLDQARVDLDARHRVRVALDASERERPHLGERQRDQVRASNAFRASSAATRSSNGTVRSANS